MTSVHPDQSEGEVENPEDPIKELIRLVINTILREEGLELMYDIVGYRRNLSQQIFKHLSDLEAQPAGMGIFYASFKAGWQEWILKGE